VIESYHRVAAVAEGLEMHSFSAASNQCHLMRSVLGELWQYWISQRGQAGESQEKQRCSHQNLHHGTCFFLAHLRKSNGCKGLMACTFLEEFSRVSNQVN